MLELALTGSVPSKKNSRVRTRGGAYIPSKVFYDWQTAAMWQVRQQTRERLFKPVAVDVTIVFGTKGRADLDNRLTSVLDMLVEALVLRDDKWQDVPEMTVRAAYRKGEPGATIRITEVAPVLQ
jgi:Holliday junction resolvase RusA-like endonuclease